MILWQPLIASLENLKTQGLINTTADWRGNRKCRKSDTKYRVQTIILRRRTALQAVIVSTSSERMGLLLLLDLFSPAFNHQDIEKNFVYRNLSLHAVT